MKKLLFLSFSILLFLTSQGQIITTVAGRSADSVSAINAPIYNPYGIAADGSGNIFIADFINHKIRKVSASTGIITTVAGNGISGFGGDGAAATAANLNYPQGVSVDRLGNIYVADQYNHRIRKINAITGIISTVAGNGIPGSEGDGAAATNANLNDPIKVTIDSSGNLYIVDNGNNKIRKVNASTGIITTIAGSGTWNYGGDGAAAINAYFRFPASVAIDGLGNLFIADMNNNRIRKVNASTGIISTVAGNGTQGFGGDGAAATAANLYYPIGVAVDGSGNLYIADYNNHRIRKVNVSTGIITTVAGNGIYSYSGDGNAAITASLRHPRGISTDSLGNLYILDELNHRIRKVNASTGIISTVVGNGTEGFGGDGAVATAAYLYQPFNVAVDNSSNLYIADAKNHRIRKVNAVTGIISTVAGNGTQGYSGDGSAATNANLNYPSSIKLDNSGNLYIADQGNYCIRKVIASTGIITTIAGNGTKGNGGDGSAATYANLNHPIGIALDGFGNLYIADFENNKIRKVNASTGIISTVAGSGTFGYGGDSGSATSAKLAYPTSVIVDGSGNLYIADTYNNRVRKVNIGTGIISTVAGNGTQAFGGDDSAATGANLYQPYEVALDASGNLYIADNGNNRIRKVNAITGIISTVAGIGNAVYENYGGDSAVATAANLFHPTGIAVDSSNNLYITANSRIRKVTYFNSIISRNQTICLASNADSIIAKAPFGNNTYTYTWLKSTTSATAGFTAIPASNTKNYKPLTLTQSTWYRRHLVSDSFSDTSSAILITVSPKPSAGFTINNARQCVTGNNFLFIDTSNVSSGTITRKWNLGTGNNDTSTLANISKSYTTANTYSVKLIVTSNHNCKDSISKTITVNPKPTVGFTVNNVSQCVNGNNFSFIDTSSISIGTINRKWNLGNGNNDTSSLASISKSYATANTYTVKLISISNHNCIDSISKTIRVNNQPIIGNIIGTANPSSLNIPFTYFVLNQANMVFDWTVTNGTIQSGQGTNAVNVVWPTTGTGNLIAKITNNNSCTDSAILPINITTVGVNNLSLDNDLNVYPNPTKNIITITNKINLVGKKYIITNLIGQTVITGKLNLDETIVNLETLQSGVYLLSIDGMNKQSIKVIKE
ncbi:MAG: PKD domain-containing protein [Bacteroidia bacterium]